MNVEIFIGFIAGFSVLLTLIYMLKNDARGKRRRLYERIEKLELAFEEHKNSKTQELITYLIDRTTEPEA